MNILLALLFPIIVGGAGDGITVYYDDLPTEYAAVTAMRCPGVTSGTWRPASVGRIRQPSDHDGRWTADGWWGTVAGGRWYLPHPRPAESWQLTPRCPEVFAPLVLTN